MFVQRLSQEYPSRSNINHEPPKQQIAVFFLPLPPITSLGCMCSCHFSNDRQLLSQVRAKSLRKRNFALCPGSVPNFGIHEKLDQYSHSQTDRKANPHQKSEDSLFYLFGAEYIYIYTYTYVYICIHIHMYTYVYMHKLKSNNVYVFGWKLPNFGQGQDWRNVFMANTFRPRCLVALHSTTIACTKSEVQDLIKHAVCWEPFICFANRVEVGWCYLDSCLMRDALVNFFCPRTGLRDWFRETPQLDKIKIPVDFPQPSDSDTVVKQTRRDCTQCCCNGLRNVYELPETLAHLQPSGQIQAGLEGVFESHKYGYKSCF